MIRGLLSAILGLAVASGFGAGLIFWRLSSSYKYRIAKKLEQATKSIPHILGKEYFDKIKDKNSVSDSEYEKIFDRLEKYVKDVGEIIYIYAYTLDEEGRIVEVADTPSSVERIQKSPFYSEFRSATHVMHELLKNENSPESVLVSGSDEYGDFWSYLAVYRNRVGKKFVIGSDIETSQKSRELWRLFYLSLGISGISGLIYGFSAWYFKHDRKKTIVSLIIFIGIFTAIFTITREENKKRIEDTLFMAARTVPEILGEEYINKAQHPDSVSPTEFKEIIQRINAFTKDIGIVYAFALRQSGNKIVYIADSTTEEEFNQGYFAGYWGIYDTSPDAIWPLFEVPGKLMISYEDDYGSFRSVFFSRYDSKGNLVVFGADQIREKLLLEEGKAAVLVFFIVVTYGALLKLWEYCFRFVLQAPADAKLDSVPQNLFWKTVAISSSTIIVFLVGFYIYAQRLLYSNYNKLEVAEMQTELDRFKNIFNEEKLYIPRYFADWFCWDDAYEFVQNGNQSFRDSILIPEMAASSQVSLLMYLNRNIEFVGGTTYDAINNKEEPELITIFLNYLKNNPRFFQFENLKPREGISGLVNTGNEEFLLAVAPVVRSDLSGIPQGFFVVARKIDQNFINNIARRQNLNLQIYTLEEAKKVTRFQPIIAEILATDTDVIIPFSDSFNYGYTILKDIDNNPASFVRIIKRRDIFLAGKSIVDKTMLAALISFGSVMLTTNLIILQTTVLSRLLKLVQNLKKQNQSPDCLEPLLVSGNDEISYLTETFNQLLETNKRNAEKFIKIFRASPVAIMIVKIDDGTILEVNSGFENLFGYKSEETIGRNISDFGGWLFGADVDKILGTAESNDYLRNIEVQIRNRDGKEIICNLSAEIITIDQTPCILYNIADISDLKQLNSSVNRINSLLQAQQETSIEGILATDEQGKIVSFNQRFCQMWYINPLSLAGKLVHQLLNDPSLSDRLKDAIERAYNVEGCAYSDEIPLDDGRVFNVRAQKIMSPERKYYGQIWYFRDITTIVTNEEKLYIQYKQLSQAKDEIANLNKKLEAENLRMSAELNLARHLQEMILPKTEELNCLPEIDIAAFMEPAEEVGGDYYDVFYNDGTTYITIGDITGHGLDSGIIMLMVQTATTTLMEIGIPPHVILDSLNRVLCKNLKRINSDKSLTLAILCYQRGSISIIGQHEEVLILRNNDKIERIDTFNLGFPIGLDKDITPFLHYAEVEIKQGEAVILFTDGVTEAEDNQRKLYSIDRLCEVALRYRSLPSQGLCNKIVEDIHQHVGEQKLLDDITLVVIKQKHDNG